MCKNVANAKKTNKKKPHTLQENTANMPSEAVHQLLLQAAERSPGLIFDILNAQPEPTQPYRNAG